MFRFSVIREISLVTIELMIAVYLIINVIVCVHVADRQGLVIVGVT